MSRKSRPIISLPPTPSSHSPMHKKIPIPLRKLELSLCDSMFPSFFFSLPLLYHFPSLLMDSFRHTVHYYYHHHHHHYHYHSFRLERREDGIPGIPWKLEERSEAREKGRHLKRDSISSISRSIILQSASPIHASPRLFSRAWNIICTNRSK